MREDESWGFQGRAVIGGMGVIVLGAVALLSEPLVRECSWLDVSADALAWTAFWIGTGLRFWATLYIGGRKHRLVVAEGPYSLCRNPLYLGSFLLALSAALFLKSATFAGCLLLTTLAYLALTIPAEEKHLLRLLGEQYLQYYSSVPRLWPRLSQFRTPDWVEVSVKGLALECRRATRWLWIPLLGKLIAHLRFQPWWPHLLRVP